MKYYIDSEIILAKKVEPLIYVYIMIIIIISLSLIIFMILFHYKTYYKVKGIVEKDTDYYIRVYMPLDDIDYVISNNEVIINKVKYKFQIVMIDSEYISDNTNTYQAILIKVDLPLKYKFNNLSLNLQFLKEDKRVIDYLIRR